MSYADINGLSLFYEEHGSGQPLVLLHGGIAGSEIFAPLLPELAPGRRVILVDLQGHGRTAHVDRPLRVEHLADDVAALLRHLELEQADVLGYSLGGEVALHVGARHPEVVRRLVLVSIAFRRDGQHPEVVAQFDAMGPELAAMVKQSPLYAHYAQVNPRPEDWEAHIAQIADALKVEYDWREQVAGLQAKTLLVYADQDSVRPDHIVEFYGLLGGGLRDAMWDGSARAEAQLAILPGQTHYDVLDSPLLVPTVREFLEAS